jgi:hypothetical protein
MQHAKIVECLLLAYCPHFRKMRKGGLCDLHAVYVTLLLHLIKFRMLELILMKFDIYITAPESILTVHFINSCHQSVFLYVYIPIVVGHRHGKSLPRQ